MLCAPTCPLTAFDLSLWITIVFLKEEIFYKETRARGVLRLKPQEVGGEDTGYTLPMKAEGAWWIPALFAAFPGFTERLSCSAAKALGPKKQMRFNIPVITLLSSSGGSVFSLSDGSKMKAEASSSPARREVQGPVKVHVLSVLFTWSLGAAKREISMPEQCHGHNNKRRFKTRGASCQWVEQVGKEVTLVHCLKQLLSCKCFVLGDAFFTKRELKKILELQAGSVTR